LSVVAVLCLGYLIARTARDGNDINVYLHAAGQLLNGENIYAFNPYNFYLYSPLFALVLAPLTILDQAVARVIWMFVNVVMAVRLWYLLYAFVQDLSLSKRRLWTIFVVILSAGFLNHNLMLGQVTILILWLTIEGLVMVSKGKSLAGSVLLALGINFKIIPMLAFVFLGTQGSFKAIVYTLGLLLVSLVLPALFIGMQYNTDLLHKWQSVINPSGERFAFEDNDGCQSLNALLPAYLYDFEQPDRSIPLYHRNVYYPRRVASVDHHALEIILTLSRLFVLALLFSACIPKSWLTGPLKKLPNRLLHAARTEFNGTRQLHHHSAHTFWQLSYLCLAILLIFPHQMKYSMLFFVPAGAYVIFWCLVVFDRPLHLSARTKTIGVTAAMFLGILAIMGRDIIGSHLVDILDYYHFMGVSNLVFLGILWYCHPRKLLPTETVAR